MFGVEQRLPSFSNREMKVFPIPQAQFPLFPVRTLSNGMAPLERSVVGRSNFGPHLPPIQHPIMVQKPISWPGQSVPHGVFNVGFFSQAYQTALALARLQQGESREATPTTVHNRIPELAPLSTPKKDNFGLDLAGSSASRKRPNQSESDSDQSGKQLKITTGGSDTDESDSDRSGTPHKATSLRGERRLVIAFESLGWRGQHPQTFGKSGALVPDGVRGSHTVYNERWRFEINHGNEIFTVTNMKCVCLTWKVTNLTTGAVTSMTETRDEAMIRNSQGQTISNKVFREALETRAKDLEKRLSAETNEKRIAQIELSIRGLRPKRFSEGPLVFGLQHKAVQDKMTETTS